MCIAVFKEKKKTPKPKSEAQIAKEKVKAAQEAQNTYAQISSNSATMLSNLESDETWAHLASEVNLKELRDAKLHLTSAMAVKSPSGEPWHTWFTRPLKYLENETNDQTFSSQIGYMPEYATAKMNSLENIVKTLHAEHAQRMKVLKGN